MECKMNHQRKNQRSKKFKNSQRSHYFLYVEILSLDLRKQPAFRSSTKNSSQQLFSLVAKRAHGNKKKSHLFSFPVIRNLRIVIFLFVVIVYSTAMESKVLFQPYRRQRPRERSGAIRTKLIGSTMDISPPILLTRNPKGVIAELQPTKMTHYLRMTARLALTMDPLLDNRPLTIIPLKQT